MPPTTTAPSDPHHSPRLPRVTRWLLGALLPTAERMEVMEELAAELAERRTRYGVVRARLWLSGQLIRSLPELVRRSWWRGMSGFEPEAGVVQLGNGDLFQPQLFRTARLADAYRFHCFPIGAGRGACPVCCTRYST